MAKTTTTKKTAKLAAPKTTGIRVIRIHEDAIVPSYKDVLDSGFDFYTVEDTTLKPKETVVVKTGLKVSIPSGTEIQVRPRSGISLKGCPVIVSRYVLHTGKTRLEYTDVEELHRVEVHFGTIDEGYRGEIGIITHNPGMDTITIPKGTRLAQGVLAPVIRTTIEEVTELDKTTRGEGGYGSTGTN